MTKLASPRQDHLNKSAIKVIQDIVDKCRSCLFMTNVNKVPLSVRPMAIHNADEKGVYSLLVLPQVIKIKK